MAFTPPQLADFKAQFPLDFPFGAGPDAVSDPEIQNALNLVASGAYYNPDLFSTTVLGPTGQTVGPTEQTLAFLYCAAHFLYKNVRARGGLRAPGYKGGLASEGLGVRTAQSVGPVNVTRDWPEQIKNDSMLFQFTQSPYGEMYLQLLTPKLVGNVGIVGGERLPTGFFA